MVTNNRSYKVMRRPFKVYSIENDSIYSSLNNLVREYMYCSDCLTKTLQLKHRVNLLSSIEIDADDLVYVCDCCDKMVEPINLDRVREEKINRIMNKDNG